MEKLDQIIFYSIDRTIRTYRQFAQHRLKQAGFTMTIDQWLVIKCILENPDIRQQDIADLVFKDNASVTRIISLLVREKYLSRRVMRTNRRRMVLTVTEMGKKTIAAIDELVKENRSIALAGIDQPSISLTKAVMDRIASNCQKTDD